MSAIAEREWLTVEEFRRRHNLGRNLVYEAVRERRIRSLRLKGKILIASDALDDLADRHVEPRVEAGR